MRSLDELIDLDEPGLEVVHGWLATSPRAVELLPCDRADGERTLLALQVTSRSLLGALALETGGLLVDHGWLRVLGAGSPRLPRGLADWNRIGSDRVRIPGAMLVGDDAVGGFFAVNGGGLPAAPGNVCYLPPGTLAWEDLALGHSAWVNWALTGDLETFYEDVRWPTWDEDARRLEPARAFAMFPPLWTDGPPIAERDRRPVDLAELWHLHAIELPAQLAARVPGRQ